MGGKSNFDVSVVMNIHAETNFLRRTVWSWEEAARFARAQGLSVELVLLGDQSPSHTRKWIENYDPIFFDGITKSFTDVDSLGLARNVGADLAKGKYIRFCDSDDLISYNILTESVATANRIQDKAIIFPEYRCSFGDSHEIYRMYPLKDISKLAFFWSHPYISHIFAKKSHIQNIGYKDEALGKTVAYEDWHFNAQAISRGFDMGVAENTVLYYRRRRSSLLIRSNASSMRIIDETDYFRPSVYLDLMRSEVETLRQDLQPLASEEIRRQFLSNRALQELGNAANRIDSACDPLIIKDSRAYSNQEDDLGPGRVYHKVCELVVGREFDHVVLMPFITQAGGEKYVLNVVNALLEGKDRSRTLIICGERYDREHWTALLPEGSVLVDLARLGDSLSEEQRLLVCLRLIQTTSKGASIHIKSCPFTDRFIERFGELLRTNTIIFYRFLDPRGVWNGEWVPRAWHFDFLSNCGHLFDRIVTDSVQRAEYDTQRLDTLGDKYRVIPNSVETPTECADLSRKFTKKLLWASRLDHEKRPDLLKRIAEALQISFPEVSIEAFGAVTVGAYDVNEWRDLKNLTYRGPFNGFLSLDHAQYDGLIYTSAFDGLPNVILEALAAGVTPIAAGVDGIPEAVTEQTGFLVQNSANDDQLIRGYVAAIRALYDDHDGLCEKRRNGRREMANTRSWARFSELVKAALES